MSDLVKATESKPTRRRNKREEVSEKQVKAQEVQVVEIDAVAGNNLVDQAVQLADAEFTVATQVYSDRYQANTVKFLQHVKSTQIKTANAFKNHIAEVYGVSDASVYGERDASD